MSTLQLEDTLIVSKLVKVLLLACAFSILGCSMPDQMSSSTQSSGGSSIPSAGSGMPGTESSGTPPGSGSAIPGDQDTSLPTGGDPSAEVGDVQGGNGDDIGNAGVNTPGDALENSDGDMGTLDSTDAQLDKSLDEFDGLFEGTTQNSNVDILDPMGLDPATSGSNEPLFEELGGNAAFEAVADSSPNSASSSDENGQQESEGIRGVSAASQTIPEDIGDGRGDNVIERQIRQAAMQETDPILRGQLWDEYRRMKGQKE